MRIEVLYVAGCPSHPAAVELVRSILLEEGLDSDVRQVLVRDQRMAEDLRFRGSPTIRVNGRDVCDVGHKSAETNPFALSCRFCPGSQRVDLPPAELVRCAVAEARKVSGFVLTNAEPKSEVEP